MNSESSNTLFSLRSWTNVWDASWRVHLQVSAALLSYFLTKDSKFTMLQ